MESLAESVKVLNECCFEENEANLYETRKQIKNIEAKCLKNLTSTDIRYICSLLFNSSEGILNILTQNVTKSQFKEIRDHVLSFLLSFLPCIKNHVLSYSEIIVKVCINVIRKDKYSKNKCMALNILQHLISNPSYLNNTIFVDQFQNLLYQELAKATSKTTSSVKKECLISLGMLAHYHSDIMSEKFERLFEIFYGNLHKEMVNSSSGYDLKVLEGSLIGLNHLLHSFQIAAANQPSQRCIEVFKLVCMSLEPQDDSQRVAIPIAGLELFQNHAAEFGDLLMNNYLKIDEMLQHWFEHRNSQLKHAAHVALDSFFYMVATRISEENLSDKYKIVFKYFIIRFKNMINQVDLNSKSMSLAVKGYGLFAGACKRFLSDSDVNFMFAEIMNRCEMIFLNDDNPADDNKIHQLPTFLQSLASISKQLNGDDGTITEKYFMSLCRLCVILIENYPRLNVKFTSYCHSSIMMIAQSLSANPDILQIFLKKIVYQGLIRSCSHDNIVTEDDSFVVKTEHYVAEEVANDTRTISYKDYESLWSAMIGEKKFSSEKSLISRAFTAAFVDSLKLIIEKLNLVVCDKDQDSTSLTKLNSNPQNSADFKVFINLVGLCSDLLPSTMINSSSGAMFMDKIHVLVNSLVMKADRFPFVSGFYKLLTTILVVARYNNYFLGKDSKTQALQSDTISIERRTVSLLIQNFGIKVASSLKQYKDELLVSCLLFILNLPNELVVHLLTHIIEPIKKSLELGVRFLSLAETAIKSLERWRKILLENKPALQKVMPSLLQFLISSSKGEKELIKENKKMKKNQFKEHREHAGKRVCLLVVRFLGSLGGDLISSSHTDVLPCATALWDKKLSIDYAVPFRDMKPVIRLEKLLPRIMESATSSGKRKAKISSCELLHSVTLYIIGREAQMSDLKRDHFLITQLYRELFPVVLKLSCDIDQVCRQMFEVLMTQIVHWFTTHQQLDTPMSNMLLQSLMNGIIDEDDSNIRESSARFLNEFLLWSFKQNSAKKEKVPSNVTSIFKKIYSYALNPSLIKRVGACLAFNNFYRTFREQDTLVDQFTLELLVVFVECLKFFHNDKSPEVDSRPCILAISHLEKIITTKSEMFNHTSALRRRPKGFKKMDQVTLTELADWLFRQCGIRHTECRHLCMRLSLVVIKLLPGNLRSPSLWIEHHVKQHGNKYLIEMFESEGVNNAGILFYPNPTSMNKVLSVTTIQNWFNLVLATLEVYSWVLNEKLVKCEDLFKDDSKLFEVLIYFMGKIAKNDASCVLNALSDTFKDKLYISLYENSIFDDRKCTVITRILQFVTICLKSKSSLFKQANELADVFWKLFVDILSSVIVCPSAIGYRTIEDNNVLRNLSEILQTLVTLLLKFFTEDQKLFLVESIKEKLGEKGDLVKILSRPFCDSANETNTSKDLFSAFTVLHDCGLLHEIANMTGSNDQNTISQILFQLVFDAVIKSDGDICKANNLSTAEIDLGNKYLQLSFNLGFSMSHFVKELEKSSKRKIETGLKSKEMTTQHSLFLSLFSKKLYEGICGMPSDSIVAICNMDDQHTSISLLLGTLENLFSDRVLRKKKGHIICDLILKEWDQKLRNSSILSTEVLSNMITISLKIVTLNPSVCRDSNHPSHNAIFQMFQNVLSSKSLALPFKTEALELLSFFLTNSDHSVVLKTHLESLVVNHFPLTSREFPLGSTQFNEYSIAMHKLIYSMKASGNLMLMQLMMSILVRENDHLFKKQILDAFQDSIENVALADQKNALNIPYQYCISSSCSTEIKLIAVNLVLVTMATKCDVNSLIEFYLQHICEVMHVIKEDWLLNSTTKWEEQLERKILAYRLIELMFSLLSEQHFSTNSSIGQFFAKSNENSVLKTFMQKANSDKNENMKGEKDLLEVRRRFHCSVYNALIAAIMCTKTDIKWYNAFLFDESSKKHQYFLDNIVDENVQYRFEIEINEPIATKKRFVAIRDSRKINAKDKKAVSYISSLADSSLSEDVTLFDSNLSKVFSSQELEDQLQSNETNMEVSSDLNVGSYVELDDEDLNKHECMASMVALINHLHQNSIGFSNGEEKLPSWLECFSKKLSSSLTHPNIRLFIAKLIINCQSAFKKFSSHFIEPMLQTMVRGDCCKSEIDSMTCDIMVTVLSWNNDSIPSDNPSGRSLIKSIIKKLSQNVRGNSKPIIRRNLDLIKTSIECWRNRIEEKADSTVLYNLLCSSSKSEGMMDNYAALQLMGVYLSNSISIYNPIFDVDRFQFYRRIFDHLSSKKREIYLTTSEIIGMTLKLREEGNEDEIQSLVIEKLSSMSKSNQDKFIYCLEKISFHYPQIVDKFLHRIFFELPKLHGDLRTLCLEIVEHRATEIQDLFVELKSLRITNFLSIRDTSLQLVCLKLCSHIFRNSKLETPEKRNEKIKYFVNEVLELFSNHVSVLCRQEAFNLMVMIYDYQESIDSADQDVEILNPSRTFLLHSLDDAEQIIRNQAFNFWNDEQHLPIEPSRKLLGILQVVCDSSLPEAQFLSNSVNLLLQSTSRSPDFERSLFEHPLSDCAFKEYVIDSSWKNRHSNMTPMFSTSLQFDSVRSGEENSPRNIDQVLSTQKEMQFSATLNTNERNTFNWTTGSSLDTFSSLAIDNEPQHRSSLLVSVPTFPKTRFSTTKLDVRAVKMLGKRKETNANVLNIDMERLRKRFRKENEQSKWRFAKYHQMKNKQEKIHTKEKREKFENSVQLYRKYRAGDLPDIQIPHKALIAPLTVACQYDVKLAQLVLTSLTASIMVEGRKMNENEKIVPSIFSQFSSVLIKSTEKNPLLISYIANLFIEGNEDIKFVDELTQSCLASNNHGLALMLLEQKLINKQKSAHEPSVKRRKTQHGEEPELFQTWIQVARIYKLLDNVEPLHGIFHGRCLPDTLLGLSLEKESKYKEASKVYQQALKNSDENTGELEKDIWEDCLINCLQNLTKWDSINQFCDSLLLSFSDGNTGNISLLQSWNYSQYQDRFLKPSLQSKFYLLLDGNEKVGEELANFFDDALIANTNDTFKKDFVKKNYADCLAMMFVFKRDYGQARYYLENSVDNLMEEWSTINPIANEQKYSILRKLSTLSDLHDFLDLMEKQDDEFTLESVQKILDGWLNQTPHLTQDSVITWNHSVLCRTFFLSRFKDRLSCLNLIDGNTSMEEFNVKLSLKMAKNACSHNNFIVAGKLLQQLEGNAEFLANDVTKVQLSLAISRFYFAQAKYSSDNHSKNLKFMQASHAVLIECNNEIIESNTDLEVDHLVMLGDTYHQLLKSFSCMEPTSEIENEIIAMLPHQYINSILPLNTRLEKSAYAFYKKAVSLNASVTLQHNALMALALFCDHNVSALKTTNDNLGLLNKYAVSMTTSVLKAIKLQVPKSNSILKFPRLLQIAVEIGGDMLDVFKTGCEDISTWIFLPWIGHILALLDVKIGCRVHDIVRRTLNEYPQALVYPFLTAYDGFNFHGGDHGKRNRAFVKSVKTDLKKIVPLANRFVEELHCLTHPVLLFKDWKNDFFQSYCQGQSSNLHQLIGNYQRMYEKLFNCGVNHEECVLYDSPSSTLSQTEAGYIYVKFADKFKSSMDKIFGLNGVKISSLNIEVCRNMLKKLEMDFEQFLQTNSASTLKDLSPWLNNFSSVQHQDNMLEMPGQYCGHTRPLIEYHVHIIGLDERIKIMPSMRKPCKITMMGSDEKEYNFLVKGGEDLRQDQRISQIFDSVNAILRGDAACKKQNMFVVNYKVIPINCKVGIIEWMNDVTTLLETLQNVNRTSIESVINLNWIPIAIGKKYGPRNPKAYGEFMKCANCSDVEDMFIRSQNKVSWDLLRQAYLHLSDSVESFLVLRKRYTLSLATMSVTNWLLGIGDRHTQNLMISTSTGYVVGIDFGHAFGSATEHLPIPELVPFRLTRQMVGLLAPYSAQHGELHQMMVTCMTSLRSNSETLLSLIDVFVKDPSVDWIKYATKHSKSDFPSQSKETVTLDYAKRKLKVVRRKLNGGNPAAITGYELNYNASLLEYKKYYTSVAKGDPGKNVRAKNNDDCLSPSVQIDCLIDQATDPNILGRCWMGWKSWL